MNLLSKLFFFALCLTAATHVQAGQEPVLRNSMENGSIRTDSFRIIEDIEYTNTNLGAYNLFKSDNYISLEINQEQIADCFLDSFSFSATIEVIGWDETGTSSTETITLAIRYDQLVGGEYKAIHTKKYSGFYKLKFTVVSVSSTALTPYIRISGEIAIERYKDLAHTTTPTFSSASYSGTTGDITVSWGSITGAEEYDLEYTFIDDYLTATPTYLATTALTPEFTRNATRVTVSGTSYSFSNVFEHGYVVFRVRAVGRTGALFTHVVNGKWSNNAYSPTLNNYPSSNYIAVTSLNPTFNWQYVNTFSEGGKRKELISFMDGTFRSRQSITRISSDTTLIVGESVYDYQGRPAMQIIPIPIDERKITYQPDFTIHNTTGDNYTKLHFDTGWCLPLPDRLSKSYGAGKYYSTNNEFLAISNHWLAEHNKYIPYDTGYVFTRTIFTPDNSGRVAVQSGIGEEHRIGSGHETKYFYGTPFQEELDHLFGNHVGNNLHYQKQMVVDPNGQVSVSYTDLSGKVIATALSGTTPANVATLSNNLGSSELEVDLNSYSPTSNDPYARSVAKAINVAVPGEYRLSYILEVGEFEDNCLTDCYECVYDLEISVKNDCGEELLDGDLGTGGIQSFVRRIKRSEGEGFSLSCSSDTIYYKFIDDTLLDEDSIRVTLGLGSYIISKTLRVSNDAAEFYADEYIATAECVKTPEDFEEYFQAIIDDFGCEITCTECTEMLSDSSGYVASRKSAYVNLGYTDNADLTQMVAAEYSAKKEICLQVCNGAISPCEFQRIMLTTDVAPGGQYEDFDGDITLHPEYCHYEYCIANMQPFRYEARMNNFENSNEAVLAGWMDPLQNQSQFPNGEIDSFFMVGPGTSLKPALESKLNYAGVITLSGTHNLTIWELSIYSAYCNSGTTWSEVSSCISGFTYDANVYQARNAYAFHLFRAYYLKARKEVLDSVKYASSSFCQGLTIPTGKTRRFLTNEEVADQFPDNEVDMEAGALTRCENFCDSSSYAWLQILGPCVMEHEDIEDIRLALVDVCARGCDGYNPMGAKTVTPGNISGSLANSFREVLEDFAIYDANTCNDLAITGIKDHQTSLMNGPWQYTAGEDCMCEQNEDTSLLSVSDPDLRIALEQLSYLEEDTVCETCATCEQVFQAYYPFFLEHGNVPFEGDSLVSIWPGIFSEYMNTQLNYNLTYEDYHAFILECMGIDSSNAFFEDILVDYRSAFSWLLDYEFSKATEPLPAENYIKELDWQTSVKYMDLAMAPDEMANPFGNQEGYFMFVDPYDPPVLITPCFCIDVMLVNDVIKNDTSLDPGDTSNIYYWDSLGLGCAGDINNINLIKEICRQAFYQNTTNSYVSIGVPSNWESNPQMRADLEELSFKHDARVPLSCLNSKDPCDLETGTYWDDFRLPHADSNDVPHTSGKLTCTEIREGVSDVMIEQSWVNLSPNTSSYWRIANYIDSIYSAPPNNRMGWWQDSAYRMERIISEISQCIIEDACYSGEYFDTCASSHCVEGSRNLWLMRNFVNDMVKPRQTGITNYLNVPEWTHAGQSFTTLSASDLYTGASSMTLENRFDPAIQYNEYGKPRSITITDDHGFSVDLHLAFRGISGQHYYGDITHVLKFKPIYFSPCDTSTLRFNMLVVLKTASSYDTLWMFGRTDTFDYLSSCGDQLTLCNTPTFVASPNPCGIDLTEMATNMATYAYDIYLDSIRKAFIHAYKTQCIERSIENEEFEVRFDQQEYHYTLYYYDLGGNLVQTVPPEGVDFLTGGEISQSMDFRKGIGSSVFASHNLRTKYKYNTLNELNWQSTPDGGVSNFWYDMLGRLVVSQNAKQAAASPDEYSYTEYDDLGRIAEVGQIAQSTAMDFSIAYSQGLLDTWIGAGSKDQITNTYYDEAEFSVTYNDFSQNYLRNRVASTTFTTTEGATDYQSAVHYDYDVHGNVKAMVRETPGLDSIYENYKIIRYEYELVSGNVVKVLYQQDSLDRFFHKYEYDADNRVIGAYTSRDQIHWDRDAKYTYYLHGPLARTELGELRVQGMDYAYTLHGWLKGVNSERLRTSHDIGKDGNGGSTNQWVCEDVFGFGLGYYAGDYKAIGAVSTATHFIIDKVGSTLQTQGKSLYNGNIGIMVTAISQFMEQGDIPFGRAFQYDQLNRIKNSRAFNNVDTTTNNKWKSSGSSLTQYATDYTYDANGNILTLLRKGKAAQPNMDDLTYHYYSGTNRLEYVDDAVSSTNYGIDIDDQVSANYTYDEIGNLVSDASEEIETINWTVYGKIQSIIRSSGSNKPNLEFEYSPDGYRSAKHVTDPITGFTNSTWYVRDASGNIMATYEKSAYGILDTGTLSLAVLNTFVEAEWGAHVFSRFLQEEVKLHEMMDGSQFTALKADLSGMTQLETALRMLSPLTILLNESSVADNVVAAYDVNDIYDAMVAYHGSATNVGNFAIMTSCPEEFATYLITNHYSTFVQYIFNMDAVAAAAFWAIHGTGTYPGAPSAASWLDANAAKPQLYTDLAQAYMANPSFIMWFNTYIGSGGLETAILGYTDLKNCLRTGAGDEIFFTILDLYNRTLLWDETIGISSVNDLTDMMITHGPGFFMQAAIELSPGRADDIFNSLPVTFHVTDYLNAIISYDPFGSSYYNQLVNELMAEGFAFGGWNYEVGEHHIYGSSRVGVHQTNLITRSRYDEGDISVTLDDVDHTSLYRGKRHYELSNHLGNVQVVVSDKRISVCDEYLEVAYFKADVLSAVDYYPFGMMMPDRQWYANSDSSNYRFAFNGKEIDREHGGAGNVYDYGFRIYNPALGKFLSVDPLFTEYPWNSTYSFAENDVIRAIDLDGLEKFIVTRTYDATGLLISNHVQLISATATNTSGANGGVLVSYVNVLQNPAPNPPTTRNSPVDGNQNDSQIPWYTGFLHPADQINANAVLNTFNSDQDGDGRAHTGISYQLNPLNIVVNGPFVVNQPNFVPATAAATIAAINTAGANVNAMNNLVANFQIVSVFPAGTPVATINALNVQRQNTIIGTLNASLGAGAVANLITNGQITFTTANNPGAPTPTLTIQQNVIPPPIETHGRSREDVNAGPIINGQ